MARNALGEMRVPIRATTEDLSEDLRRAMGLFGSTFRDIGKLAAGVFGGLTIDRAVQTLLGGVRTVVAEMADAERQMLQTEARLRSTGAVAGVTAESISRLSTELARLSGGDDAVIQAGQNLLLTFTNIRNEVGEGNDIFDRATKTALDMAVALYGGPESMGSAARQLGQALNDPVRGLTMLQRAGVSFTAAQREQIQALAEGGRLLDAQKAILAEVEKAVGGAAEAYGNTFTGSVNRAKEALLGLASALGEQSGGFDFAKTAIRGIAEEFQNLTRIVQSGGLGQAVQNAGLTLLGTAMEMVGLDSSALAERKGAMDREAEGQAAVEAARVQAEKEEAARRTKLLEERRKTAEALAAMQQAEQDRELRRAITAQELLSQSEARIEAEAAAEREREGRKAVLAAEQQAQVEERRAKEVADEVIREARRAAQAMALIGTQGGGTSLVERLFGGKDAESVLGGLASLTQGLAGFASQLRGGGDVAAALSSMATLAGNLPALLKQARGSDLGRITAGFALGQTASTITGGPEGGGAAGALGSLAGTALGAAFGPVGSLVGGALGGAIGGLFGRRKRRFELPPEFKQTLESVATLSREGIVNLTDLAKTYEDQIRRIRSASQLEGGRAAKAFLDQFVKIAGKLSSAVTGALGSGISNFLLGRNGDLLGALRTGIQEAVAQGVTDSLIQGTLVKGALGDLLGQLSEQLVQGADTRATIAAIGDMVPTLTDSLLGVLQPLRQVLADAFSGRAPGLGSVDRSIPLLDGGGLVRRDGLAMVHAAEVVGLPSQLAGAAMDRGPYNITVNLDGRTITRAVLDRLPRELRIKGVPV